MRFNDYQEKTGETAVYPSGKKLPSWLDNIIAGGDPDSSFVENFLNVESIGYCVMGLVGEAGELANKVKKIKRDNPEGDLGVSAELKKTLIDELGDVLWYVSELATCLGYDLSDVAKMNLSKLESRKERGTIAGSGDNR